MIDLSHRLRDATRAVEDTLVAAHGIKHDLAAHHAKVGTAMPPFWVVRGDLTIEENEQMSLAAGLKEYGPGVLFNLWSAVRAIEGRGMGRVAPRVL